mmetsp:Transcript_14086/g.23980  ORF Transcript_14086/g.23980 Transcript_14086/m.23980 type:complete len:351 (-) Transcript_14086:159-1211(-)
MARSTNSTSKRMGYVSSIAPAPALSLVVLSVCIATYCYQSSKALSSVMSNNNADTHEVVVYAPLTSCDEEVLDSLDKRFNQKRSERQNAMKSSMGEELSFDIYEPEATCLSEERFGTDTRYHAFGDGPKFICGVDFIAHQTAHEGKKCLVYSVGSNNDVSFEKAVHTFMDGCEVHTFDPTLSSPFVGGKYATFHPWGLGKDGVEGEHEGKKWSGKSFETIIRELGHENCTIDVLKIDCEGCEWDTMSPLFELMSSRRVKINQVLIELHLRSGPQQLKDFFGNADKAKMRVFHKERNGWGCGGKSCVEYALASETFLREANRDSICPYQRVKGDDADADWKAAGNTTDRAL